MSISENQDEVEISTLDAATSTAAAGSAVDEMMVGDNGGGSGALDFSSLVPLCVARETFSSHQVPVWDSLLSVVGTPLRVGNTQPARARMYQVFFFFLPSTGTLAHSPLSRS